MDTNRLFLNDKEITKVDGDIVVVAATATATSWTTLRRFVHEGSNVTGLPTEIFCNAWKTAGGGGHTWGLRIIRSSDSAVICSITGINSSDTSQFYDLGVISNFPTTEDILIVQMITSNSSTVVFGDSIKIKYG